MSSTHIELIRLKHELCEKYEIAIGEELDSKPSGVCYSSSFSTMMSIFNSIAFVLFI